MPIPYPSFRALSFDIYGTLIDWESGLYTSLLPLLSHLPPTSPLHPSSPTSRARALALYNQHELAIQAATPTLPYTAVVSQCYVLIAASLGLSSAAPAASAAAFAHGIGAWPAFPDTVAAMQALGRRYQLIALSNVDAASFAATRAGPLAGVRFDAVYVAEDIGSYKPDLRNFAYLVEHARRDLGVSKAQILHVAQSLGHDHVPAKEFGLAPGVWVARSGGEAGMGGRLEEVRGRVELGEVVGSLGELTEVVEKAWGEVGEE